MIEQASSALIAGKSLHEWNESWTDVPGGFVQRHPDLRNKAGLFRALLNDRVMALGKGADRLGGLAKRVADFSRASDSARDHYAGFMIHKHLHEAELQVLITGTDAAARWTAAQLKTPMILLHHPAWTTAVTKFSRKRQRLSDNESIAA